MHALADDVRAIFDGQGLTKDLRGPARTSSPIPPTGRTGWAGSTRAKTANGRISTLCGRSPNIDFVGFDNYLPLSDWTTGDGGLDAVNWLQPAPVGAWPPSAATMSGLGLTGAPTIY